MKESFGEGMKRIFVLRIFILTLGFILLFGCQSSDLLSATKVNDVQPTQIVTPAPGKSIVTGEVLGIKDGKPFGNTPVRLAQVYRKGEEAAYALDMAHSPSSISDVNGNFMILDVPPAEYVIIIGKPEDNNYVVYQDEGDTSKTYKIEADKVVDVGVLKSSYTP